MCCKILVEGYIFVFTLCFLTVSSWASRQAFLNAQLRCQSILLRVYDISQDGLPRGLYRMRDFEVVSLVQYHQYPPHPLFSLRHWYTLSNMSNYYIGVPVLTLSIGAKYHFPGLLSFFHGSSARLFWLSLQTHVHPSRACCMPCETDRCEFHTWDLCAPVKTREQSAPVEAPKMGRE